MRRFDYKSGSYSSPEVTKYLKTVLFGVNSHKYISDFEKFKIDLRALGNVVPNCLVRLSFQNGIENFCFYGWTLIKSFVSTTSLERRVNYPSLKEGAWKATSKGN